MIRIIVIPDPIHNAKHLYEIYRPARPGLERPTVLADAPVCHRNRDRTLQRFQLADDQRAVRPMDTRCGRRTQVKVEQYRQNGQLVLESPEE
jgi:hypothetical protein